MIYQIINRSTGKVVLESMDEYEIDMAMEYDFDGYDYVLYKMIPCNGCGSDSEMRHDAYGVPTGHYCDKCYNDPTKYRYRKDRYPTLERDGYGDRLDEY